MHIRQIQKGVYGLGDAPISGPGVPRNYNLSTYHIPTDAILAPQSGANNLDVSNYNALCSYFGIQILQDWKPGTPFYSERFFSPSTGQYFCGPVVDAANTPVSQADIQAADLASALKASGGAYVTGNLSPGTTTNTTQGVPATTNSFDSFFSNLDTSIGIQIPTWGWLAGAGVVLFLLMGRR